jgi:hypothetical protein
MAHAFIPSNPRAEGTRARAAGLPITANPYSTPDLQRAWDDGWQTPNPATRLRAALERLADVCPVTRETLPALDEACAALLETAP